MIDFRRSSEKIHVGTIYSYLQYCFIGQRHRVTDHVDFGSVVDIGLYNWNYFGLGNFNDSRRVASKKIQYIIISKIYFVIFVLNEFNRTRTIWQINCLID